MAFNLELFPNVLEKNIDNRGKTPPISETGYPLIEVKHIQENRIYPVFEDTKFVDQETWDTWFRAHLEPEDILFSTVGSIARSCLVPGKPKFCIAQNVLGFRVNRSKADPRYIYYAINDSFFQNEVHGRTVETVQKSIKVQDLKTCRIPLPPLPVQKVIARILGTLDDKIELNRQMNATLEAMARALFKSWFVDFVPYAPNSTGANPPGWMMKRQRCSQASLWSLHLGRFRKGGKIKPSESVLASKVGIRSKAKIGRNLEFQWLKLGQ
jgi:type I restriction enzyme, S subunit